MIDWISRGLTVEAMVTVIMLAIAFGMPQAGSTWFRVVERKLRRIGQRRWLSVALVGVLSLAGSALVSLLGRMRSHRD